MLVLHCEEKVLKYKQSDKQFEMIRAKLNANAIEFCLQCGFLLYFLQRHTDIETNTQYIQIHQHT